MIYISKISNGYIVESTIEDKIFYPSILEVVTQVKNILEAEVKKLKVINEEN